MQIINSPSTENKKLVAVHETSKGNIYMESNSGTFLYFIRKDNKICTSDYSSLGELLSEFSSCRPIYEGDEIMFRF